jgi:hypothetical protein
VLLGSGGKTEGKAGAEDEDVAAERQRVAEGAEGQQADAVVLKQLRKVGDLAPGSAEPGCRSGGCRSGRGQVAWAAGVPLYPCTPGPQVYPTSPPKLAVEGLSLGISWGERFGFLGSNGAGQPPSPPSSSTSASCLRLPTRPAPHWPKAP